jgi:hypothetical protein
MKFHLISTARDAGIVSLASFSWIELVGALDLALWTDARVLGPLIGLAGIVFARAWDLWRERKRERKKLDE